MSLPETIWWCPKHQASASSSDGPCKEAHVIAYRMGGNPFEPNRCRKHIVEVELHPVGSRVAGPDDLLIRREADGEWPADIVRAVSIALHRQMDGRSVHDGASELRANIALEAAALAAAEGGAT